MTVGVLWEFIEFGFDTFFGLDMQKDSFVTAISSVALDPTNQGRRVAIDRIARTTVTTAGGATTTFSGALAFSVVGYLSLRCGESGSWAAGLRVTPLSEDQYEKSEKCLDSIAAGRRRRRRRS